MRDPVAQRREKRKQARIIDFLRRCGMIAHDEYSKKGAVK
jgi:hypothetical protein